MGTFDNSSNLGRAFNKGFDGIQAGSINRGSGYNVIKGPQGTSILVKENTSNGWRHTGYYDASSSYMPNEVVRVSSSLEQTIGGITYTSTVGFFVCVSPVPLAYNTADYNKLYATASKRPFLRKANICYAPFTPEPTGSLDYQLNYTSSVQGRFWEMLGGASDADWRWR